MKEPAKLDIHESVRFGEYVVTTGNVSIDEGSSVWHHVVLRGDVEPITIGKHCNIQDSTVMHGQLGKFSVTVGDYVSIGHGCILHGCQLADHCFIGMGSMVMNGACIGSQVLVAAGSLVPQGARFDEPYTLVMGRPAKVVRKLNDQEIQMILDTPKRYISYAAQWLPPREPNG